MVGQDQVIDEEDERFLAGERSRDLQECGTDAVDSERSHAVRHGGPAQHGCERRNDALEPGKVPCERFRQVLLAEVLQERGRERTGAGRSSFEK